MAALANGFPARPSSTADLDSHLLAALSWSVQKGATLGDLSREFTANADRVLAIPLPYEPTPPLSRRLTFDPPGLSKSHQGIVMVAHCISAKDNFNRQKAKVTLSSGFVIGNGLVVTCAHTFEEVRRSPSLHMDEVLSGSFVISESRRSQRGYDIYPVKGIPSCIPRSDVLLLEVFQPDTKLGLPKLTSLPISPYPVHKDTRVRAHFVTGSQGSLLSLGQHNWSSWMGTAGVYRAWAECMVQGYRDFSGRETHPGTYDALSHMMFTPLPTPGSSGGPIVDEGAGTVVGMVLGSQMDGSRINGMRGWGVPAEIFFEMFGLPGLEGKK